MKNRKIDILVKSGVAYSFGVQKGFEIKKAPKVSVASLSRQLKPNVFKKLRVFLLKTKMAACKDRVLEILAEKITANQLIELKENCRFHHHAIKVEDRG